MNKVILSIAAVCIMFPTTIVSLWGGGIILVIFDITSASELTEVIFVSLYMAITILAFLSIAALWVEIINRIFYSRSLFYKPLVRIPIHIGASISVLSIMFAAIVIIIPEILTESLQVGYRDIIPPFSYFSLGSPLLLPYIYIMRTNNAFKRDSRKSIARP